MFVHKKKHRSGRTSVVVVDKSHGKFREIKNFVVASSDSEIADLCRQASEWLRRYGGQLEMDFIDESEKRQEEVQKISVEHTKRIMGGNVGLLFYDVTTLYFETAQKDILRDNVFSKDGKTASIINENMAIKPDSSSAIHQTGLRKMHITAKMALHDCVSPMQAAR